MAHTRLRGRRSVAPVSPDETGNDIVTDIGRLAHRAIGDAIRFGVTTPKQIDALVDSLTAEHGDAYLRRRAQKVRIAAPVRSYLWRFDLRATHVLVHCEYVLPSSIADLVWRERRTGAVLIDELKTGLARPDQGCADQTARHLAGGSIAFGQELVGVRVVRLARGRAARLHRPDGRVEPIPADMQGGLA